VSASRALESSWRRLGWLRRSRLGRRRAGFVAPPGWVRGAAGLGSWRRRAGFVAPPGWVTGFATTRAPQKRRGNRGTGEKVPPCDADRAKIPPLSIRQHRRTPCCGGTGVQHGSRTTESAAAASQGSPQLAHRRKGGETAERAKKSLPATLIARKSLHRGGGGGALGRERVQRGTHSARHTARNPLLTTHNPHRGRPPTDPAGGVSRRSD